MSDLPPPPTTPAGGSTYGAHPPHVPNYLVQSILATVLCCVPLGVVSIVYATQVNTKLAAGDVAGAIDSSNKAKTWLIVAVVGGLIFGIVYGFILFNSDTTTTTGY